MNPANQVRNLALVVLVAIVLTGLTAFLFGALSGVQAANYNRDPWSPRNYVAKPGDCFVPPQGDPLYDSHYAEKVNSPNCGAFKDQAQAKNIDAQTRAVNTETNRGNIYMALVTIVFLAVITFFVYVAKKGSASAG